MTLPFQYIQLLWLLLLVPVLVALYFYAFGKKKAAFRRIGDADLVKELTSGYNTSSFPKKFIAVVTATALILLSIANFRSDTGDEKVSRNGIDVMIALDVSNSMLAQDVQPTRLDRAKQLLNKLTDRMGNNRIGLVVFAGKAYLQMPLTGDHSAAKMYLASASPESVPTQGTVIGDALKMCFASFNPQEKKYKAVVLISDGEDRDENSLKVAGQMAQEGVVIYTVGIGSPEGSPIMDAKTNQLKKDNEGNTVITRLNEKALADIAEKGNGTYQLYTNSDAVVSELYGQLSTMDKRSVTDDSLKIYKSWFQYLLAVALLLLIIELFISEVKKVSRKKLMTAITSFLLCCGFSASAQTDNESIKKGNDAYKRSDFESAAKNYDAAVKNNEGNATAHYNLGNALYKADKKEEAINAYDKAAVAMITPADKSTALYNKGVAHQNNKKRKSVSFIQKRIEAEP
ncbi:MAG: VWA domain-containing protein [Ferruginibacter sp.]